MHPKTARAIYFSAKTGDRLAIHANTPIDFVSRNGKLRDFFRRERARGKLQGMDKVIAIIEDRKIALDKLYYESLDKGLSDAAIFYQCRWIEADHLLSKLRSLHTATSEPHTPSQSLQHSQ